MTMFMNLTAIYNVNFLSINMNHVMVKFINGFTIVIRKTGIKNNQSLRKTGQRPLK